MMTHQTIQKPGKMLVDGDNLVWRTGWIEDERIARAQTKYVLESWIALLGVQKYQVFLGDLCRSNFRYTVDPDYKKSRKGKPRPPSENKVREYLIQHHGALVVKGVEVDDALGIEQDKVGGSTIIASNDKDLAMIPGWHFDTDFHRQVNYKDSVRIRKEYKKKPTMFVTDPGILSLRDKGTRKVLLGTGFTWFCCQLLLGDSADDIKGIPKMGDVRVYEYLKDYKTKPELITAVWQLYKNHYQDQAKAQMMKNSRLLWIKRERSKFIFPLELLK